MTIELIGQTSVVLRGEDSVPVPGPAQRGDLVVVQVYRGALPPEGFPPSRQQRRWQEREAGKVSEAMRDIRERSILSPGATEKP